MSAATNRRRPTNFCGSQTRKGVEIGVQAQSPWTWLLDVGCKQTFEGFTFVILLSGSSLYSSCLHTCLFHALYIWLILETPGLCSKVSYASSQFFDRSAVLRNEMVTMANNGGCGGVTSFRKHQQRTCAYLDCLEFVLLQISSAKPDRP
jgi:hypothetical protein